MGEPSYWEQYESDMMRENLASSEKQKDERLTQWQLDLTNLMEELAHNFRGDTFNVETNKWETNKEYKLMNEKGIREIINKIALANRNIFLSNFTEEEIVTLMRFFMISFTNFLALNYGNFEIEKRNLTMIKEIVVFTMYPALKRGLGAGERKSIYQTQKVIETNVSRPSEQSQGKGGGILGTLFRRK